eukprot:1186871-Prorocentrum_minimum.AAC.2
MQKLQGGAGFTFSVTQKSDSQTVTQQFARSRRVEAVLAPPVPTPDSGGGWGGWTVERGAEHAPEAAQFDPRAAGDREDGDVSGHRVPAGEAGPGAGAKS